MGSCVAIVATNGKKIITTSTCWPTIDDWTFVSYHYYGSKWLRVLVPTLPRISAGKWWKPLWAEPSRATLIKKKCLEGVGSHSYLFHPPLPESNMYNCVLSFRWKLYGKLNTSSKAACSVNQISPCASTSRNNYLDFPLGLKPLFKTISLCTCLPSNMKHCGWLSAWFWV